eukprot:gb/GECG01013550.1/.p1 GENE.gb/GECG01013550.1/~~gb/GECG01013550.1/.p1  ORF type:complete len:868 (+),score=153.35 gb/GECG01013550.1/:1-2604(+)
MSVSFVPRSQRSGSNPAQGRVHSSKRNHQQHGTSSSAAASHRNQDEEEEEESALKSLAEAPRSPEMGETPVSERHHAAAVGAATVSPVGRQKHDRGGMEWMKQPFSFEDVTCGAKSRTKRNREEPPSAEDEEQKRGRAIIDKEVAGGKRDPHSKLPYGLYNPSKYNKSDNKTTDAMSGPASGGAGNSSFSGSSDDVQGSFGMQLLMKGAGGAPKTSQSYGEHNSFGSGMTTGGLVASSSSQQRLNLQQARHGEGKLSSALLRSATESDKQENIDSTRNEDVAAGDNGVYYKLKAIQRAKEEAERRHVDIEAVAIERWGSMDKLTEGVSDDQIRVALSDKPLHPPHRRKYSWGGTDSKNEFQGLLSEVSQGSRDFKGTTREGQTASKSKWRERKSSSSSLLWEDGSVRRESKPKAKKTDSSPKPEKKDPLFEAALRKQEEKAKQRKSQTRSHTEVTGEGRKATSTDQGNILAPSKTVSYRSVGEERSNTASLSGEALEEPAKVNASYGKTESTVVASADLAAKPEAPSASRPPSAIQKETDLNKLHAKAMRAKMKNQQAQYQEIMQRIDEVKASIGPQAQSSVAEEDGSGDVEIVSPLDENGRRLTSLEGEVEGLSRDDMRGGRKKGKTHGHGKANLKDAQGESLGYFVADAREASARGLSREKMANTEAPNVQEDVAKMARQEKELGRFGMDEAFAKNIKRLGKHFQGEGLGLATGKGANSVSMSREGTGIDEDEEVNTKMFEPESERLTAREKQSRDKSRAIRAHRKIESAHRNCMFCLESEKMKSRRYTIIAVGEHNVILLPPWPQLVEGHCIITPREHVVCYRETDEDAYDEANRFRQALHIVFEEQVSARPWVLFSEYCYDLF